MSGPSYHARTHLPGGTDPIQTGSAGVFTTYKECTLQRPTLWSFWPMADASGGAVDVVGGRDMAEVTKEGYPSYGHAGVYSGLPAETAIEVQGDTGSLANDFQRLTVDITSGEAAAIFTGTHAWTIEFWVNPVTSQNGTLFSTWSGAANNAILIGLFSGRAYCVRCTKTVGQTAAEACPTGVWTHVRVTFSGTTLKMFINGVETDSEATTDTKDTSLTLTAFNGVDSGANYIAPVRAQMQYLALYTSAVTDFCAPGGSGGSGNALDGMVLTADGTGATGWEWPTVGTFVDGV